MEEVGHRGPAVDALADDDGPHTPPEDGRGAGLGAGVLVWFWLSVPLLRRTGSTRPPESVLGTLVCRPQRRGSCCEVAPAVRRCPSASADGRRPHLRDSRKVSMPDRPSTVPRLRWYLLVVTFPEAFVFFQGCLLASVDTAGGARVPAPARQAATRDLVFLSSHIPSIHLQSSPSRAFSSSCPPHPHPHPHPHTRPARQGKAQGQPKLTRPAPAPPRALTRIPQSSSSPSIPPPAASEPPPLVSTFSTVSSQPPFPALPQDHATSRSPTRSGSAIYFFHPHHPVGRTHIVARFPVANGSQRLVTRPGASACSTVPDFYPLSPAFFIITNPLPLSA
ncbi:hypothetical protein Purlil1_136 [Purpureocillium lilacinum]|uniref:Uncharacterized protein n=1 Tax=Purpureocillium lilacinum TaxID=33203 RepID=A0ABR0CGI7_PURLI|nr:hypothetical protein Purlil1_136 [Purpureocillium lilacinum]